MKQWFKFTLRFCDLDEPKQNRFNDFLRTSYKKDKSLSSVIVLTYFSSLYYKRFVALAFQYRDVYLYVVYG